MVYDEDVPEKLEIAERTSVFAKTGKLIIAARTTNTPGSNLVIGRVGMPNTERYMQLGDAILFETPDEGLLEIRVMKTTGSHVNVMISRISKQQGLAAGLIEQDTTNAAFSEEERKRIDLGIDQIRRELSQRNDIAAEQLDFITRKLDELKDASRRMGRRDWLNVAIGTLTSTALSAALSPEVTRALFKAADTAFSWLFSGGLKLLSP